MIHFSLPGKCGDVVLSTAAIHQWLQLHPKEDIVFWTETESAWVYRHWERVKVETIEYENIQRHFREKELISYLKTRGARRVICLNAWPNKLDLFKDHNLLNSFFALMELEVPSPPYELRAPVNDPMLEQEVNHFLQQIASPFVIISRHSKTLPSELSTSWWQILVRKLSKRGFTVVDNIAGNETALPNTSPIVNWPYPKVLLLSQLAKATVGVRSGITDVVAAGSGRLISLISQNHHNNSTYTSFKLRGDIVDVIYKQPPPHKDLLNILVTGNKERIAASITY